MKKWHFPLIRSVKNPSIKDLIDKVKSELKEFERETNVNKKAAEAIDILHSAETLVRQFFQKYPSMSFHKKKRQIIKKNRQRGYYR